ncbi:SpoIIE family protein phosphatase [Capillimicrobium parvum]|uniref:protein-serine/threonine phosphatase n=1 Tax=Capillimicrobium parvum TaxID=2884022 RepID=A0A9E6Y004_9ACTN|nr:SpoIIE family protein phosphatase [Capillimicrobium parvum]UGS37610.1 Sensor histidine kinase RcsC [Capillimicrobium parvum]
MSDALPRPSVLLVDDRPENLVALQATLSPLDCDLVTASSGAEALRHLLDADFAAILLDVQMPELDGFETARYIKQRERTRDIPIIFVTAISKEREHVFRGYEAGAVDYVFKPYDPELLRSKVAVFVELWRAGRRLRESEALQRAMFDSAPIGMARLDAGGRIAAVNRALRDTLGRDEADLIGRTLDELTHPEDRGLDAGRRAELLDGGRGRYDVEKRLLRGDGRPTPALLSHSVVSTADAEPALLVQVQDLAERKRAERQRELLIREQAARVQAEAVSQRLRAIQRIVDAALAPLPLDRLLAELLRRMTEVLGVDTAAMVLCEEDDRHVIVQAAEGVDVAVRRVEFDPAPGGLVQRVVHHREPVVIDDVAQAVELGADLGGQAVTSVLAVPLLLEESVMGTLIVGTLFGRSFSPSDVSLLQVAADRATLAIERARLFEREHQIAQQLQRALLPERLPSVPGLRLAARYLPGGAGTKVGGDWYDALALPGGRLALVMGDVAGRGVIAAATMGQLRSALRAYALEDVGPAEVLTRLNRFQMLLAEDSMATVVLLVLDPQSGTVRYANAGHPPPILLDGDHEPVFLDGARSTPLGALDDALYTEATAELGPGTTVVLYTDGLVERRGSTLDEGFARLRDVLAAGGHEPEELCEAILGGALGAATSSDDVTFVVANSPVTLGSSVALALPGEAGGLASLRTMLRRWLVEQDAGEQEVHAVTMATNEAVQNAIEHAHGLTRAPFEVQLERDGDDVVVSVRDRGRWHEGSSDDRGRGLPLMRALMDEVEIDALPNGTTVRMRRRVVS